MTTEPARGRRVVLGRFHDGSATPNWGGRATSLALAGLVHGNSAVSSVVPLNGTFNTLAFEKGAVPTSTRRPDDDRIRFGAIAETAASIISAPRNEEQRALLEVLEGADELWMNGEGDFILRGDRVTLARTLLISEIALQMGLTLRIVNSICSLAPGGAAPLPVVVRAVHSVLSRCASVLYRDPESLELHRALFPALDAEWVPDALFSWAGMSTPSRHEKRLFGPSAEGLTPHAARFLASSAPYVAISGSSATVADEGARLESVRRLVAALRDDGYRALLVAADRSDSWLEGAVASDETAFVGAEVPLATGRAALAGARAFVSGRYHPSILAYGTGVPCVLMESNSHKTRSLQRVMGETPCEYSGFGAGDDAGLVAATLAAAGSGWKRRRHLQKTARACAEQTRKRFSELARNPAAGL